MEINKINTTCFEESEANNLRPITLACPAYAVTNAIVRCFDLLKRSVGTRDGHVRPHLQKIQKLSYRIQEFTGRLDQDSGLLLVNARIRTFFN
ncbi:MAG: hypothetical protein CBE00_12465 [Planctomycetaceae bacterium TMED240]|nr:hypothetical protein [Rhodopirellula sp.]OUX04438.1 MAG: hypothetical protein CBE00_12465 [Planctomycetaceae bacterium TMED240]